MENRKVDDFGFAYEKPKEKNRKFGLYKLVGKDPVPVELKDWSCERLAIVERTEIGNVKVSTVFLGIDHSFGAGSKPVLFETMIFGGKYDQYQVRYHTWDEARKGHQVAVELVKRKWSWKWLDRLLGRIS